MDKSMVVHVGHRTRDLPENEEEAGRGKDCFAELLPKTDVLGAVRLEKQGVPLHDLLKGLLEV